MRRLLLILIKHPLPALVALAIAPIGGGGLGMAAYLRANAANAARPLEWRELLPPEVNAPEPTAVQGIVRHGELGSVTGQPASEGSVTRFDGERVQITGYAVPLAFEGTKVVAFLLVPCAGACIHVPPPPANQIIYVTAKQAVELDDDAFRPVSVSGRMKAVELATAFAETGYQVVADDVTYTD
jgi:uncharacterized protein